MASTFHSTGRFTLVKIVEFPEKEKERLVIMIVDDEPAILAVLTEFLRTEEPTLEDAAISDVVAHWIDCEPSQKMLPTFAKKIKDRDKLITWMRRIATADGEVSRAELDAVRAISEALRETV